MSSELEAIRKRHDAIIPGPWRWYGNTATNQVYLATTNRGRLIVLTPAIRTTEYVYDYDAEEGYELTEAVKRMTQWCRAHRDDGDDTLHCTCGELREFLSGELDPSEGHREFPSGYYSRERPPDHARLVRGVQVHEDLRFAVPYEGDHNLRKERGGILKSYRTMARYEVLGKLDGHFHPPYRTLAEYAAEFSDEAAHRALYREDFIGLDNPEAEFIQHAPEDVAYLLARVHALEEELRLHPESPRA